MSRDSSGVTAEVVKAYWNSITAECRRIPIAGADEWASVRQWFVNGIVREDLPVAETLPSVLSLPAFEKLVPSYRQWVFLELNSIQASICELMCHLQGTQIGNLSIDAAFVCWLLNMLIARGSALQPEQLERYWRLFTCCRHFAPMAPADRHSAIEWLTPICHNGEVDALREFNLFPHPFVSEEKDVLQLRSDFMELVAFTCFCGEVGGDMVKCDADTACVGEQWYHKACVGYDEDNDDDPNCVGEEREFFCSACMELAAWRALQVTLDAESDGSD